jgi:enoyl-CoA hydratase
MVTGTRAAGVVSWQVDTPGVMVVTLNRPPANALGLPVLDGLHAALDAAEASLKVMIVASAVDGFFAAGADIRHMSAADAASFAAYGDRMRAVNDRLAAAPWISVAAVDGLALGGGLELAISCTMRVSGPRARDGGSPARRPRSHGRATRRRPSSTRASPARPDRPA